MQEKHAQERRTILGRNLDSRGRTEEKHSQQMLYDSHKKNFDRRGCLQEEHSLRGGIYDKSTLHIGRTVFRENILSRGRILKKLSEAVF
jgi:hypothetical protein